ncbi:MAG: GNAT family N-acetyltransferase [Calditrichaeota bacterium]|nr:MAG: GNAT family N-acetyltransferase [Calditrichota bacterium]
MSQKKDHYPFTIRKATEKDVKTLFTLVKELAEYEKLLDEVKATENDFLSFGFGTPSYFNALLVETDEGTPVGFALYFFTFSTFEGRPSLYLEDIYVKPVFRGKGIGKQLLKKLVQIAIEKDCNRMEWAVLNWNTPAIEFYQSLGAFPMNEWTTYRLNRETMETLKDTL